ncbi:MAG TPA: glycosyltransferase family 2 protein [Anaerolineaceae bacterium]|nr:glycosyltransferase family 2 protein [Anaerolineaceae bacterium]
MTAENCSGVLIMTAALPKVEIIIINWNGKVDTLACLDSLRGVDYPAYHITVVDNGSADDSVAVLRAHHPEVVVLETGENLGFVGGNNVGLDVARSAGADYALLLNNDTEVAPDFLTRLVAPAETDPRVGITGPSIYYYSAPHTLWSAGGRIDWRRGTTSMIGLDEVDRGQYGREPRAVDFVTGCALLIRMSAVDRVGVLDPRFFLYYEETEWCVRVARAGYRILHVPEAKIWHKISNVAREASPMVHYYMTRNRLLFLKLSRASAAAWLHTALDYTRTLASWSLRPKWRGKRSQRRAMARAILDFTRGQFGRVEVAR